MNEIAERPVPYRVSFSQRVTEGVDELRARAGVKGVTSQLDDALVELYRRLRIYPQFGQPLMDLNRKPLQIWIGVVPPLVVRYILDEEGRQVLIGRPLTLLPNFEF